MVDIECSEYFIKQNTTHQEKAHNTGGEEMYQEGWIFEQRKV